jgi:hypothetical protein
MINKLIIVDVKYRCQLVPYFCPSDSVRVAPPKLRLYAFMPFAGLNWGSAGLLCTIPWFDPKRPIPPSRPCAVFRRCGGGSVKSAPLRFALKRRGTGRFLPACKKYRTQLLIGAAGASHARPQGGTIECRGTGACPALPFPSNQNN